MDNITEKLCLENKSLYYFHEICKIPHCTDNEKGISDYIYNWARHLGMEVIQEECWNLIIKKPATKGLEKLAPILLQAHLDMVCTKSPNSTHDFMTDPIEWKVEGDWISSANGSSLGADCGIGVALIMQILADKQNPHPALEVLLTVREESDMYGAYNVDPELIKAKRMINLDTSPETKLLAGTCGGTAIEIDLPLKRKETSLNMHGFEIKISGLKGGHSGHDINKGYGNALLLMGRLIFQLKNTLNIEIEKLWGGTSRLSIPMESYSKIRVDEKELEQFGKLFLELTDEYKTEYVDLVPNIDFSYKKINEENLNSMVLTHESDKALLNILLLIPNGINQMSNTLSGSVESSQNLGIIDMDEEEVLFKTEIRSSFESTKQELIYKNKLLADTFGAKVNTHSGYPSWSFRAESALREKITSTFKDMYETDMDVYTVHAGNEIGILLDKFGDMDAVAMGPNRIQFHTPDEKLSISSSVNFEKFLWKILSALE